MSAKISGRINFNLYSERGLVYYFVKLADRYQPRYKEYLEQFLGTVKFESPETKRALDNAIKEAAYLTIALEPSFGKYGDPDLILYFSNSGNVRQHDSHYTCVFIEAKKDDLVTALTQDNTSNIAVQFLNKVKLSKSKWDGSAGKKLLKYDKILNFHLKKPAALEIIERFTSSKAYKAKTPLDQTTKFFFVALTAGKKAAGRPCPKIKLFEEALKSNKETLGITDADIELMSGQDIGTLSYADLRESFKATKNHELTRLMRWL
ncbi:MAG: hypothetical protein PHV33_13250 [Elusimicrobiales bacterium]|nr:hypothetical protein [Elusimicrobiales bacterium]